MLESRSKLSTRGVQVPIHNNHEVTLQKAKSQKACMSIRLHRGAIAGADDGARSPHLRNVFWFLSKGCGVGWDTVSLLFPHESYLRALYSIAHDTAWSMLNRRVYVVGLFQYQDRVTVFIVGYQDVCYERLKLLQQVNEVSTSLTMSTMIAVITTRYLSSTKSTTDVKKDVTSESNEGQRSRLAKLNSLIFIHTHTRTKREWYI